MKEEWRVGEKIQDRYVVKKVFRGGMGTVYIVFDPKRHERYAVKSPRKDKISVPGALARFIREAEIWVGLGEHSNIVRALFVDTVSASTPLLFLEYVEGSDLRGRMETDPGDLTQVIDFALQFCNGMQYAYEKSGMVHRDIKPENVLATPEGLLKVTDFGLAKTLTPSPVDLGGPVSDADEADIALTRRGAVFGTLPYMSLEQLRGGDHVGPASDVYSFGVMFYEMLTGRLPFSVRTPADIRQPQGADNYVRAFIESQTRGCSAPPSALRPECPRELDDLVMTCLDSRAEERFADFAVIRQSLLDVYEQVMRRRGTLVSGMEDALINEGVVRDGAGRYEEAVGSYDAALKLNPRSINGWHNRANSLMNMAARMESTPDPNATDEERLGRFDETMRLFQAGIRCSERSLELAPNYDLAWNTKGGCLLATGRLQRALECFDRALAINVNYVAAWYNRSSCLRRLRRHQDALDSYDNALRRAPEHANAWSGKGVCLGELGRYAEALACFDWALAINPRHAQARQWKQIWGDIAAGRTDFGIVLPPFAHDLNEYFQGVLGGGGAPSDSGQDSRPRRSPRLPTDQTVLELTDKAWGLKNIGQYDEALRHVAQAIALDPDYSTAYLQQGRIFRNMGRYDEAVAAFDKALSLDPDYPLVWLNKGLALLDQGRYEEALALADRYIRAEPNDPSGWNNKGNVYAKLGRFAESIACYDEALKINPRDALAWANRAASYTGLNQLKLALQSCERALEMEPLMEQALLQKGEILKGLDRVADALSVYEELTTLYPRNANAWLERASCMVLRRERPEFILECCRKAAALGCTDHFKLNLSRGRALYELKRYEEAARVFGQLIAEHPNDKTLWLQQAVCFAQPDRWREAAECYVEALRLAPSSDETARLASSAFQLGYPEVFAEVEAGVELMKSGEYQAALPLLARARDACPRWWEIRDKLGAALQLLGLFEEAAEQYEASLEICTSFAATWVSYGSCRLELGEAEEAVRAFDKALNLEPDLAVAWYCKGAALYDLNKPEQAQRCFAAAARLDPRFSNPR